MSAANQDVSESALRRQLVECTRIMVMAELLDIPGRDANRSAGLTLPEEVKQQQRRL